MKKMILACAAAAFLATGFTAKAINTLPATAAEADNKTQVDPAALPDAVKATLAGDSYKGWTVSTAWLVKSGSTEYYQVELSKDNQKNTVKLDKDGKTV